MLNFLRLLLLVLICCTQTAAAADCVVLLHGLGRTHRSMIGLARSLEAEGYTVVNQRYPSRKQPVAELSAAVGHGIDACRVLQADRIHFVTNSLGGILVRYYFQEHVEPEAQRAVMLSPPNHGSELATLYRDKWWYKWFTGPAGQELGVDPSSQPNQLRPVPLEIGIIAGTKSVEPWFSRSIAKPNDGKVSVASAQLPEMQDFITVPHSHPFLPGANDVAEQVNYFLAEGRFLHEPAAPEPAAESPALSDEAD